MNYKIRFLSGDDMSGKITTYYEELKRKFEEEFDSNLKYSNKEEVNMYLIRDIICELLDLLDEMVRR